VRRAAKATVLIVLAGFALAACSGSDEGETTDFETTPTRIEVTAGSGNVTVDGSSPRDGTVVTIERNDAAADTEVSIDLDENGLLTVSDGCGTDADCEIGYRIEFDADSDVAVTAGGGLVVIGDVTGSIVIDSGGGDLTLASTSGEIEAATGGGRLLGTQLVSQSATIDTGGGDTDVTFNEPIDDLSVSTDGGRLTAQLSGGPYLVDADAGGGSLSVLVDESADAERTATLRSDGGDITVYRR